MGKYSFLGAEYLSPKKANLLNYNRFTQAPEGYRLPTEPLRNPGKFAYLAREAVNID